MSVQDLFLPGLRGPGRPRSGLSRVELVRRSQAERRKRLGCITISIPVPKSLHSKLRAKAEKANTTLQTYVVRALERAA